MKALILIMCIVFLTSCNSTPLPIAHAIDKRQDYVGRYRVEYYIQNDGIQQGVSKGPSGVDTLTIVAADSINKLKFITRTDTFSVQLTDKLSVQSNGVMTFSLKGWQAQHASSTSFLSGEGFFRNDTISYQRFYSVSEPTRTYNIYYFCYGPQL